MYQIYQSLYKLKITSQFSNYNWILCQPDTFVCTEKHLLKGWMCYHSERDISKSIEASET